MSGFMLLLQEQEGRQPRDGRHSERADTSSRRGGDHRIGTNIAVHTEHDGDRSVFPVTGRHRKRIEDLAGEPATGERRREVHAERAGRAHAAILSEIAVERESLGGGVCAVHVVWIRDALHEHDASKVVGEVRPECMGYRKGATQST